MFTESELRNIIRAKISYDENFGEQVGGSGHLGHVSYEIDSINRPERVHTNTGEGWRITYYYILIVETEFTYYPDNPPYEYKYRKTVIVNDKGQIITELPKEVVNGFLPI